MCADIETTHKNRVIIDNQCHTWRPLTLISGISCSEASGWERLGPLGPPGGTPFSPALARRRRLRHTNSATASSATATAAATPMAMPMISPVLLLEEEEATTGGVGAGAPWVSAAVVGWAAGATVAGTGGVGAGVGREGVPAWVPAWSGVGAGWDVLVCCCCWLGLTGMLTCWDEGAGAAWGSVGGVLGRGWVTWERNGVAYHVGWLGVGLVALSWVAVSWVVLSWVVLSWVVLFCVELVGCVMLRDGIWRMGRGDGWKRPNAEGEGGPSTRSTRSTRDGPDVVLPDEELVSTVVVELSCRMCRPMGRAEVPQLWCQNVLCDPSPTYSCSPHLRATTRTSTR